MLQKLSTFIAFTALSTKADLPVNCKIPDFWGTWTFNLGLQGDAQTVTTFDPNSSISPYRDLGDISGQKSFKFSPDSLVENVATGSSGFVTFIYNQGFEFQIDGQIWFADFAFGKDLGKPFFNCSSTSMGYVHDQQGRNWARFQGNQVSTLSGVPVEELEFERLYPGNQLPSKIRHQKYRRNDKFIERINQNNDGLWTAQHNEDNEKYTLEQIIMRSGTAAPKSIIDNPRKNAKGLKLDSIAARVQKAIQNTNQVHANDNELPTNLDYRNYLGQNWLSPVDDQGACGSCFSFASAGALESRARILTNNTQQPIFSEQEIITCGKDKLYNQGCGGGFGYQTAGKYAMDFGFVEESCAPYNPADDTCPDTSGCTRWYADSSYGYLGGYYGATQNDGGAAMMQELFENGPYAVGFEVLDDFKAYTNGVYVAPNNSDKLKDPFNPFVRVNHAVLMVGYGVCDGVDPNCAGAAAGTPYWICKNSWGTSFGMQGYFYILRGVNEVGIESMPIASQIVPQV